tara:strand:+ start:12 stop:506 length:495 start_codon:yes stop_codon:yes gene_type:complete
MSTNLEVLLSIAEISVAFAGFSGIITAVVGRNDSKWDPGNLNRFRLMIFSSLSAIIASLLPFIFLLNSNNINWTWCVGLLGFYLLGFSIYWIRAIILARHSLNNYVSLLVSTLAILATSIQFIALTGFMDPDLGIYFLGVFYLFIQTCIAFIRLVTEALLKANN